MRLHANQIAHSSGLSSEGASPKGAEQGRRRTQVEQMSGSAKKLLGARREGVVECSICNDIPVISILIPRTKTSRRTCSRPGEFGRGQESFRLNSRRHFGWPNPVGAAVVLRLDQTPSRGCAHLPPSRAFDSLSTKRSRPWVPCAPWRFPSGLATSRVRLKKGGANYAETDSNLGKQHPARNGRGRVCAAAVPATLVGSVSMPVSSPTGRPGRRWSDGRTGSPGPLRPGPTGRRKSGRRWHGSSSRA